MEWQNLVSVLTRVCVGFVDGNTTAGGNGMGSLSIVNTTVQRHLVTHVQQPFFHNGSLDKSSSSSLMSPSTTFRLGDWGGVICEAAALKPLYPSSISSMVILLQHTLSRIDDDDHKKRSTNDALESATDAFCVGALVDRCSRPEYSAREGTFTIGKQSGNVSYELRTKPNLMMLDIHH